MIRITNIFLLLVLFGFAVLPARARQDFEPINTNEIDILVRKYHDSRLFNGAVLVAKGDDIIYQNGFGQANLDWGIPNTPDTRFRIGSVTKQFTAALILQLAEEGKLDLNGKITDYLPDYPAETGDRITIHQLLNHTSGIPNYTAIPEWMAENSRDPFGPDELLAEFSTLELDFEPGRKWNYSNSGYFLLGVIVEHVAEMDYDDALSARILEPLGLGNTGYDNFRNVIERRATGYQKTPVGYEPAAYIDSSVPYAAGMMYSTVGDLHKWTRALHGGKVFTNPESFVKMTTPYLNDYGYGIAITTDSLGGNAIRTVAHNGGINGFSAYLAYSPDEKYTVVTLDNSSLGTQTGVAVRGLIYGETPDEPALAISDVLGLIISEQGIDAGIERYHALSDSDSDAYDFGEGQLNRLGYYYLQNGDTHVAIQLFKLNVSRFPEAANPYDSLGEAYLKAGIDELALENYRRALELNPENEGARAVLKRFGIELGSVKYLISAEDAEAYVGEYELAPNFILSVTRKGTQLFTQATGQSRTEIFPSAADEFFLKVVSAQLTFNRNDAGTVESLTLHQGGQNIPSKKIK